MKLGGRAIAKLHFDAGYYFNAAMIGVESDEAKRAAQSSAAESPPDFDVFNNAVARVQRETASILGVDEREITVFHNTTAAVERVIQRVCQELQYASATLLTSDLEYPGIIAHLDEAWPGRVAFARVSKFLWQGEAELVEECLREAVLLSRPEVVYLSHVARSSGYQISERLIDFIREVNPRTVIILDGAQAVGNIVVDSDLLKSVSFYVTSGHKWLGGRPALGLVYAEQDWLIADPAQGYSKRSGSGGTGSLDALQSLGVALTDFSEPSARSATGDYARMREIARHNARLARRLCDGLTSVRGVHALPVVNEGAWRLNGIVTLISGGDKLSVHLIKNGFQHAFLHQEPLRSSEGRENHAPRFSIEFRLGYDRYDTDVRRCDFRTMPSAIPATGCARLSLHYYHHNRDVDRLLDSITAFSKANRRQRAR